MAQISEDFLGNDRLHDFDISVLTDAGQVAGDKWTSCLMSEANMPGH
jgi:hypothetical protein